MGRVIRPGLRLLTRLTLAILLAAVAACGGGSASSPTGGGGAPAAAPPATADACSQGVKLGTPGVITIACGGSAVIKVSGAANGQVPGGTCTTSAGLLVANAGVVTDHTYQGPRPNFLSVNTPPDGGSGQDVGATVILDGKLYGDGSRFGGTTTVTPDHKSIHFSGSAQDGEQVTLDVAC